MFIFGLSFEIFSMFFCKSNFASVPLKCFLYSHACARSFDPAQWAREQQALAHDAINARMAPLEQPTERQTDYNTDKRHKYSALLNF